jgi:hypothetical protein
MTAALQVGETFYRIENPTQVIEYFEQYLRLTFTGKQLGPDWLKITEEGHYVIISKYHIVYARVTPDGKKIIYDPLIDQVLTWEQAQQALGSRNPTIYKIVPLEKPKK